MSSRIAVSVCLALCVSATALAAQTPTGPGAGKPGGAPVWGPGMSLDSVGWHTWTEDEVVEQLVYMPLKWMGLRRFPTATRPAIKPIMEVAEVRVRFIVRAVFQDDADLDVAHEELAAVFREYVAALEALSGAR